MRKTLTCTIKTKENQHKQDKAAESKLREQMKL